MREGPPYRPRPAPWHLTYFGVTALGIGLLLGELNGLGRTFGRIELVVLGAIVGMFAVTSLLHWYDATGTESKRGLRVRRR